MKILPSILIFLSLVLSGMAQEKITICIDQEGFYPVVQKRAVVMGKVNDLHFALVDWQNKDTVFRGQLSDSRQSLNSSTTTRIADFSSYQNPGKYFLVLQNGISSPAFFIKKQVHHPAALSSLKAYYYIRASMALDPKYAGKWARASGHPDTVVYIHESAVSSARPAGTKLSSPGGWYDAGDYNKYIVNSGITMSTLLSAYSDFKLYFDTLHTGIPSTGKGIPDILNEILYNLRWMLTMQDPEDGGVYHKCTNADFDGMIMPDSANKPRYLVQKGTAATLDFAAVMAQSSRIFKDFQHELPGLSEECRKAAEKAWSWAENHPDLVYDQNRLNQSYSPKIVTGGYGDRKFSDEWFWAASELWVLTEKNVYWETIQKYQDLSFGLPSWSETGLLGYYSLIRNKDSKIPRPLADSFRTWLIRMADQYVSSARQNAFLTVMGTRRSDFNWGSNSNAANQGILLIQVYFLTRNSVYLDAALGNLEYLCGRNATGYCFITGIGTNSPLHPHHRPSSADGIPEPVPGLLVGGPNPGEQDHCKYDFHEPETAYSDSECSYASNEIAINWNAPLVYLSNAMEALETHFTNPQKTVSQK